MKTKIAFLLTVIALLLCSCGKTSGVPESVILRDIYDLEAYSKYELEHNYDSESHIDDVRVTLYKDNEYGTKVCSNVYSYQFNKGTDNWERINNYVKAEFKLIFDTDAIIGASPWTGQINSYSNTTYSISINMIDIENMVAEVEYTISYNSFYREDISETKTVELVDCGTYWKFEIATGDGLFDKTYYVHLSTEEGVALSGW